MATNAPKIEKAFPHLVKDGYAVTSAEDRRYNCIAWAAGVNDDWWDSADGYSWPGDIRANTVQALIGVYASLGFGICQGSEHEIGFDRVAIYGDQGEWTHASRQLKSGKWTSKLGRSEDIEHANPEAVANGEYGKVVCIMKRPMQ